MRLLSPHAHDAALAATTAPTPTAKVMACYLATLLQTRFLVAVFFFFLVSLLKEKAAAAKRKRKCQLRSAKLSLTACSAFEHERRCH